MSAIVLAGNLRFWRMGLCDELRPCHKEGDRGGGSPRVVCDGFALAERKEVPAHVTRPKGPRPNPTTKPIRRKLRDASHRPHKIIWDDLERMAVGSQLADPRLSE